MIWKVGKPFTGLAGGAPTSRTSVLFVRFQKVRKMTEIGPFLDIFTKNLTLQDDGCVCGTGPREPALADFETGTLELLESEGRGPGSHMRRNGNLSK